ncbi:MAG: tetratricopeptide repeat protein [Ignavibacteria bacterium]|nr:tetratricopeptide repeat protein [Ignavibacteria bacterium]
MNLDTLKDKLKQAEEFNNTGKYDEAEKLATSVLVVIENETVTGEDNEVVEQKTMHCSALNSLAVISLRRADFQAAISIAQSSLDIAEKYDIPECDVTALTYNILGNVYRTQGTFDKALEFYEKALAMYLQLGDTSGAARVTGNIGLVYSGVGSFTKALEYYQQALAVHKELGEKSAVARVNGNIGVLYYSLNAYDKALEFMKIALIAHIEIGEKQGAARVTGNLGNVYDDLGSYDKALECYEQALSSHKEQGDKSEVARVTGNIGAFYADKNNHRFNADLAEEYLSNAIALSAEIGDKIALVEFHKSIADLYESEEKWKDFAFHFKKYIEIKDELNIEETKKQDAIREQQKAIELTKAKADAKHQATEQLLHNVLPPSIADKMIGGTKLIAEKIPSVSVLFADIVNFTNISQRITPEELVEGLDRIFSTFDALAEKYGLEKIKTIGDAYMVVSGAPLPRPDHAEAMAHFALEMLEAMKEFRSISTGEEIQIRIGIHSGEVVAGVIGKKKFAYDLWGDAVNTASRMESHGEAGKIHCTEEFVRALSLSSFQSFQSFKFVERGEMAIKGKGMMKTYYLQKATL